MYSPGLCELLMSIIRKGTRVQDEIKEKVIVKSGRFSDTMTLLIRQLQATEKGLPIEIYTFASTTAWGDYEAIQADLFDHLFAILPEFELRGFQNPSGEDFKYLAK